MYKGENGECAGFARIWPESGQNLTRIRPDLARIWQDPGKIWRESGQILGSCLDSYAYHDSGLQMAGHCRNIARLWPDLGPTRGLWSRAHDQQLVTSP